MRKIRLYMYVVLLIGLIGWRALSPLQAQYQVHIPSPAQLKESRLLWVTAESDTLGLIAHEYIPSHPDGAQPMLVFYPGEGMYAIDFTKGYCVETAATVSMDISTFKQTFSTDALHPFDGALYYDNGECTYQKPTKATPTELHPYYLADTRKDYTEKYPLVKIGNQIWMGANLRATTFRGGTPLASYDDNDITSWKHDDKPAQKAYKEKEKAWGTFYNYHALDPKEGYADSLAPLHFSIPTLEEFATLAEFIAPDYYDANYITNSSPLLSDSASLLKLPPFGEGKADAQPANNHTGLAIPAAGYINNEYKFEKQDTHAYLWTASPAPGGIYSMYWAYDSDKLTLFPMSKNRGLNIRCVYGHPLVGKERLLPTKFQVHDKDTHEPLSDAIITIGDLRLVTSKEGIIHYPLKEGTYDYSVAKENYHYIQSSFTVEPQNTVITIELVNAPTNTITFCVENGATKQPLSGVQVCISGSIHISDTEGKVTFQLTEGDYTVEIKQKGFLPFSKKITVKDTPQEITLSLEEIVLRTIPVKFFTTDSETNKPISRAHIFLKDHPDNKDKSVYTNDEGIAEIPLAEGIHIFSIRAEGYIDCEDKVVIPDKHFNNQPMIRLIVMNPKPPASYYLYVSVFDSLTKKTIASVPIMLIQLAPPHDTLEQTTQFGIAAFRFTTPGEYLLRLHHPSYYPHPDTLEQKVTLKEEDDKLAIYLSPRMKFHPSPVLASLLNVQITLAPQPANDQLIIRAEQPFLTVRVVSTMGNVLWEEPWPQESTLCTIPLTHLPAGLYWVQLTTAQQHIVRPFVIKR